MTEDKIRQLLKDFTKGPDQVLAGTVIKVDEENLTIDVDIPEEPELVDVRLKPAIDDSENYVIQFPKEKTGVLVGIIENDPESAYLISCNSLEKFLVKIGETDMTITAEDIKINSPKIVINGGENLGLTNIKSVVEKLNALEEEVNAIKDTFTNWAPAPMDGGAALKLGFTQWASQKITLTEIDDLEDKIITH